MGLIEGDGWWRKHGVTTVATIVEVEAPTFAGEGLWNQNVVADVTNPETGALVRLKTQLYGNASHSVGETMRVRFSPKRDYFRPWSNLTVPKDEWLADQNAPVASAGNAAAAAAPGGVQIVNASGADPAAVLAKLAQVKAQGLISEAQYEQAKSQLEGAAPSPAAAPPAGSVEERLQRLKGLHAGGAIDDQEYADERRRVLDSL